MCLCVGVFQSMGNEVAVLAVVIDAAVSVIFTRWQRSEQQSVMKVWVESVWVCERLDMQLHVESIHEHL